MKQYSQACDENRDPILTVLKKELADCHKLLEIGSGTGQHAVYFGKHLPHLS
ncbi:MAG: class I SAM-dependent methyltransferase, partial [Gammaproteobacteria bacterium]|nr:class I SAM-dependent methyltransferase [Gammaproteobacteria bacterium]